MLDQPALVASIVLAIASPALAGFEVDLGTFVNAPPVPAYGYVGAYGTFVSSEMVTIDSAHTVIRIDLAGIMNAVGATHLDALQVIDLGTNTYGATSPGADIDLLQLSTSQGIASGTFSYLGPNVAHIGESSEILGTRVAAVDAISGSQDLWDQTHVSLGQLGSLTMAFGSPLAGGPGQWGGGGEGGGEGESGGGGGSGPPSGIWVGHLPLLRVSEAGYGESFRIMATFSDNPVPAPSAALLLLGAARRGRRRRR
ncbi:MAG: hypothetical protein KDA22_06095 [Phycisphaerales bacterium]|nr:hypothetical protein [Phycisphaerales bacterium]